MLLTVLSGFLFALMFVAWGQYMKGPISRLFFLLPLSLFAYLGTYIPMVAQGETRLWRMDWIPSMGIGLDFYLDGLSLFFGLLITGIGTLIFSYASAYMKGNEQADRFFGYLSLFMGSMLGLVFSDNLLCLFLFWELTSISSFFLIGFKHKDEASRKSALLALAITGGGGYLFMGGWVLLGQTVGTYSIQAMVASRDLVLAHPLYGLALMGILAGAFTKSAQFPFHFWLPSAMKAPTPVSAYLHSATMVKAGIYLLARLFPVLGGTAWWTGVLVTVGGITMIYGAFHALFRTDLKGVLAYSTISALGVMVFLLGWGTSGALMAVSLFILVHALYKAGLFMVAGTIDHRTGTRDITRLGGLRTEMRPLAWAGLLLALSSAGFPFTLGFLGKELIYEASTSLQGAGVWVATILAVGTNVFLLYAGLIAGVKPFAGKRRLPPHIRITPPSLALWLPALLLAALGLLFGIFPQWIDRSLLYPVARSMDSAIAWTPLALWHGWTPVVLLSGLTLILGGVLYLALKPKSTHLEWLGKGEPWSPATQLRKLYAQTWRLADFYTNTLHSGYLRDYLFGIILFTTALLGFLIGVKGDLNINWANMSPISMYELVVVGILFAAIYVVTTTRSRLTAVVSMSVLGYCICLLFVFYSAPDLAMTQFTIDTLTVVLFVLVLFRLPPFLNLANPKVKVRDGVVSVLFGSVVSLIALDALDEPITKEVSKFYGDYSYVMAKGKNVVNVILVDFRGFDTMFEITVLSVAAIGVFSLLKLKLKTSEKE